MSGTRRSMRRSRGYFGVALLNPKHKTNVGSLWRQAFLYDAAFVATIGARYERQASDTPGTANHIPLNHYRDFDDLMEHLPHGCRLVGVELDDRAQPLDRYTHPLNAVYLLGAEDNGIPPKVLARCHQVVQIPGVREFSMNVAAAGSIVMYDRFVRGGHVREVAS